MKPSRFSVKGFTLIEMVIFVVVLSIIVSGVMLPFITALRKTPDVNKQTIAQGLAQAQMELILGQRRLIGVNFTDACTSGCTPVSGFTVTSAISTPAAISGDTASGYAIITVTVSGKADAVLQTLVSNY